MTAPRHARPAAITAGSAPDHGRLDRRFRVQWRALTTSNVNGTTHGRDAADREQREGRDTLIVLQLIIGAFVLLALGVAAYFVIRRQPATAAGVEETAAAIAGGDLNRRVPDARQQHRGRSTVDSR